MSLKAADIHPEVQKGIEKIKRLDPLKQRFNDEADAIQSVSPIGQAPPSFYRMLDRAIAISRKQAIIWNNIRNFVLKGPNGSKTIWQIAHYAGLLCEMQGDERYLDFTANDINIAISKFLKGEIVK